MRASSTVAANPFVQREDLDLLAKLAVVGGAAFAVLRWLFMPMITLAMRKILGEEIAELKRVTKRLDIGNQRYGVLSRDLYDVEQDVEELWIAVRQNRDLTQDVVVALDATLGMERRRKGDPSDLRHLPEIAPRLPRRSHRSLFDEEQARADEEVEQITPKKR